MDKNSFFARTMHTPDSPERAELRAALREISKALIPLHRHLIDAARSDYAFAYDTGATPSQLVELLQNDPFFAWLKPLTAVIVDIDEMARRDFEEASVLAIPRRIEKMFAAEQYVTILQRDVEVAGAHAVVRKALQRLTPRQEA
jgi:hypothetical protein